MEENNSLFISKKYYEEQLNSCTVKYCQLHKKYEELKAYLYGLFIVLVLMSGIIITLCFLLNKEKHNVKTVETVIEVPKEEPIELTENNLYNFLEEHNAYYPDILVAQAKLESGHFKSNIAINANNLFGMCKAGQRNHIQSGIYKGYVSYTSWMDSALDRILWDKHYFESIPSREEYLSFLSSYAEDSLYVQKIESLL